MSKTVSRHARKAPQPIGRSRGKSGLPEPLSGQPFSLIGTLRRCTSLITAKDAAQLLTVPVKTVYAYMDAGKIPEAFTPIPGIRRIDPAAWVLLIESDNPHLNASARAYQAAA